MAETNSLLNCRTRLGYRGFESPLLRQEREEDVHEASFFLTKATGYGVVRLARLLWEQEIACSNQAIPTERILKVEIQDENFNFQNYEAVP